MKGKKVENVESKDALKTKTLYEIRENVKRIKMQTIRLKPSAARPGSHHRSTTQTS